MNDCIRKIEDKDNQAVEDIIRSCLIEFHADHEGTAWTDPDLGRFSQLYNKEGYQYWVIENKDGKIVGGAGIAPLEGIESVCELQKMYCLPCIRGTGLACQLMDQALQYAKQYYQQCYIETLDNMIAAKKFYEKYGFRRIDEPLVKTSHYACNIRYIKDLDD
ncbi:MAG: GNAT family N-acetyltransferase [Faecalibacillus sp.]